MDYTLKNFRNAAEERLKAATTLLDAKNRDIASRAPALRRASTRLRAQLGAYLVQVGLECWLKARILALSLSKEKSPSVVLYVERFGTLGQDGRKRSPIFDSAEGHRLTLLAQKASLERLLKDAGKPPSLMTDRCWARMTHGERPYSLRYGAEEVSIEDAQEELERGRMLENIIAINIPILGVARR
ncbi:MAG TPA: hypothetical protein VLS89_07935 [Candidatus Nanopelagicales bacterium]|nr:hypothetical protein [Candidatus Nanopelagicales bacterium]